MKRIFILFCLLVFVNSFTQNTLPPSGITPSENYVFSRTYVSPVTTSTLSSVNTKTVETVSYFDGLGRPKQSVAIKASPTGKDIVSHIEYDGFGRQVLDYLPVPQLGTLNGAIVPNPLANATTQNIYGSEKIYSRKSLENSPLNRIDSLFQVGSAWANKPVTFKYEVNDAHDAVINFTITATPVPWTNNATFSNLIKGSNYADAMLYKNTVKDEDGNETIEFKNGEGQTLLVRKDDGVNQVDTYYVYNEYNQLAFVVSPLAVQAIESSATPTTLYTLTDSILNDLCYQYRYDGRGRLVEKKLPGKGWEYMVYDKQDRLVLTQDANLAGTNNNFKAKGWLFTKYDQFGRVVYTGFFKNTATRSTMQTALNNMNGFNNEVRVSTASVILQGLQLFYTKNAFPTGSMTLLSVNYYDSYPTGTPYPTGNAIQGTPILEDIFPAGVNQSTQSLSLASFVKNIEDDNWTKNYSFYDRKGRVIGSHSINHLGGYTKTESILDFTGVLQNIFTDHKRLHSDTEVKIEETFSYDHQNRLLVHKHHVNNQSPEILAENTYNEIGQLDYKKVGNNIQKINYAYNIRGWMTKINDPSNLGNKLFAYEIRYDNPTNSVITPKRFNGNISEVDWSTSNDQSLRRYNYTYDRLNRLLGATYQKPNEVIPLTKAYNEEVSYDANGNILTLKRYGGIDYFKAQKIDDLTYKYNGNQLHSVTDSSTNYLGYPDISGNTIGRDSNGNMTNNKDKGINLIEYNYSNLITGLIFEETYIPNPYSRPVNVRTNYRYDSNGTKLRKTRYTGLKSSIGKTIEITDYLNGFHYLAVTTDDGSNNIHISPPTLQFIPTADGYYDFIKNTYIYNYTDHLGNIRLSYYKNSAGALTIDTESNYYPFGLKHEGYNENQSTTTYNYKYNGKELQETGMYDYGARMYMPDIGRWGVVDPLADTHPEMTPYRYSFNNPINATDPTGLLEDWVYNTESNSVYWNKDAKSQATAGANETYLGTSGTYTTQDGSITALNSNGSHTNNFLLGGLGIMNNLDPLIQAGKEGSLMSTMAFGHNDGSYIRETPASNSPEMAMRNPSGQLAVAGLYALQGGTGGIATEYAFAKIGLAARLSWSARSVAGDGLGGLGVQTSFSSGGVSMGEAASMIPSNFIYTGGLNKGQGFKFENPAAKGNHILLEYGNPASGDAMHKGMYFKINTGGMTERVPLQGNPTLNIGR